MTTQDQGFISRVVHDPIKMLLAGMMKNAVDDIEIFIANADKDYFADTKQSRRYVREYLRPVVGVLEWLAAADDDSASLVSFNSACEVLGIEPEPAQELFLKKIRGIPNAGRIAIHRYISGILSNSKLLRKHRLVSRGKSKDSDC